MDELDRLSLECFLHFLYMRKYVTKDTWEEVDNIIDDYLKVEEAMRKLFNIIAEASEENQSE